MDKASAQRVEPNIDVKAKWPIPNTSRSVPLVHEFQRLLVLIHTHASTLLTPITRIERQTEILITT